MPRRHGRRNRERQERRVPLRYEWWHRGRPVVVVEVDRRGTDVTVRVPSWRVDRVARELAADWLKDHMPRLTHDERYALLWSPI